MAILHQKSLGDLFELVVDADPNGQAWAAAPKGSTAKLFAGEAQWLNADGAAAWKRTDVGSAVIGQVNAFLYAGSRTVAELNALSPQKGEAYVATGATDTPTAGTSDELDEGDLTEFDGTSWKKTVDNASSFPPAGTRALVASSVAGYTLRAPLSHPGDSSKIAEWDGTSLTPSLSVPAGGQSTTVLAGVYNGAGLAYVFVPLLDDSLWVNPGLPNFGTGGGFRIADTYFPAADVDDSTIEVNGSDKLALKDAAVTDAKVAADNKDGATGTASMRTLGTGAQQAAAGDHTHSEFVAKIDDVVSGWYSGGAPVGTIDLLGDTDLFQGLTYRAESAGTPAYSGSDTVAIGDLIQWRSDSGWQILVANSGGYVPAGTRVLVSPQPAGLRDEAVGEYSKVAVFPGDASAAIVEGSYQAQGTQVKVAGSGLMGGQFLRLDEAAIGGHWKPLRGWSYSVREPGTVASTTVAPAGWDQVVRAAMPILKNDDVYKVSWSVHLGVSDAAEAAYARCRWNNKSDEISDEYAVVYPGNTAAREFVGSIDYLLLTSGARTITAVFFDIDIGTSNVASTATARFASVDIQEISDAHQE